MRDSLRRHRFALAFIALVVLVVFLPPLLKGEVFSFRDHSDYFQPLRYYTSIHISHFVLPYWNPYSASGEPWLANPQAGVFYPPMWIFIVLPFATAYMLYLAFHLLILGWGAYLLFARDSPQGAALAGALALTFCGPVISLLDVSNNLATFAWIPLVIWCALTRARVPVAASVLAMSFLAAEPFFAAIGAAAYVVLRFMRSANDTEVVPGASIRQILLVAVAAFGLSAIQLLPFVELIRGSDRAAGLTSEQIFRESMPPLDWLRVALPPHLENGAFDRSLSQHFIPIVYVGVIPVALALVALAMMWRRWAVAGWLATLVVAIVVAAGDRMPVTGDLFVRAPVTMFRYPSRVVPFGAMAIIALAVMGWTRLRPQRRWADLILALLVLLDLLPRVSPLMATLPFIEHVSYSRSIGRGAKILRMNEGPLTNRSAWIAGYLNLYQRRFDAGTAAPLSSERYTRLHDAAITRGRLDLLNFLAVGYVFAERDVPLLKRIAHNGAVSVFANTGVPPMASFWTRVRGYGNAEDALRAVLSGSNVGALSVSGSVDPSLAAANGSVTSAAFLSMDARHARALIDAPADGVLLLTQQDASAWRVFVDGKEKEKLLAGGIFRAVALPRGRHEVIWRYESRTLQLGAVITIITALSLLLRTFVKRFGTQKFSS